MSFLPEDPQENAPKCALDDVGDVIQEQLVALWTKTDDAVSETGKSNKEHNRYMNVIGDPGQPITDVEFTTAEEETKIQKFELLHRN